MRCRCLTASYLECWFCRSFVRSTFKRLYQTFRRNYAQRCFCWNSRRRCVDMPTPPKRSAMATIHSWQKKWGVMVDICTFWSVPRRWFCFQRDGKRATLPALLKRTKLSHDDPHPANGPDSLTQFSEVTLPGASAVLSRMSNSSFLITIRSSMTQALRRKARMFTYPCNVAQAKFSINFGVSRIPEASILTLTLEGCQSIY
jgi:hypothetical protein